LSDNTGSGKLQVVVSFTQLSGVFCQSLQGTGSQVRSHFEGEPCQRSS
jgi:hypothetical protein